MDVLRRDMTFPAPGESHILNDVIIGIGASTGGTETLPHVLQSLPKDMPGILIVQHMPPEGDFITKFATRLDDLCRMKVQEARHGDEVKCGHVFLAPANHHLRVVRKSGRYYLSCTQEDKCCFHRPSIDVLFHSMAENVNCRMIGIILTGMGYDGAEGLLAMRRKGAYTIGQDRESSAIYGMAMEAKKIGAVETEAPSDQIAGLICQYCGVERGLMK